MERNEVLEHLNGVFRKEFDNKAINLNYDTVAKDVEEWDSLSHIQLIVAIEKSLKIRFTSAEIQCWQNVGQMVDTIEKKLPK